MRVALIQMAIELGKPGKNFEKAKSMINAAVDADLIILPELWSCGYDFDRLQEHAEESHHIIKQLSSLAKENVLHIICGSLPILSRGKVYNSSIVIDSNGERSGSYQKIHLFPNLQEPQYFTPGDMILPIETALGKLGVLICFDLRFPELARTYSSSETKLIIVPAQWPAERIDHWRLFLQARSLENQLFMVGVNSVGKNKTMIAGGHSMVVSPRGEILSEGGTREKIVRADFELGTVNLVRNEFRVWRSRRRNLYQINYCYPLQSGQSDPQSE